MDLESQIRQFLAEHPNASANQVAQGVGGTRQTVLEVVRRLRGSPEPPPPAEPVRKGSAVPPTFRPTRKWKTEFDEHPVIRGAPISEDVYVANEVAITRAQMKQGRLHDPDGKRLERCERYARWRYRGYLVGEVASL